MGEACVTLGDPIGLLSKEVSPGSPITEENLEERMPRLKVRYHDNPKPVEPDPRLSALTFDGYLRPDGSVGAAGTSWAS